MTRRERAVNISYAYSARVASPTLKIGTRGDRQCTHQRGGTIVRDINRTIENTFRASPLSFLQFLFVDHVLRISRLSHRNRFISPRSNLLFVSLSRELTTDFSRNDAIASVRREPSIGRWQFLDQH